MTIQELLTAIGQLDNEADCNLLFEALRAQTRHVRATAARLNASTLKAGDKVRLHGIRPKYLDGATGIVVSLNGTKIEVRLDDMIGRFSPVVPVNVPASCVEAIG